MFIEVIQAAGQLGIVPCIVLVILFLVYKHQNAKQKQDEQQKEIDRDSALLTNIGAIIKAVKTDVEHTPEDEDIKREINEYISDQLYCLINNGANRAYYFSYHNGGKDLLGRGYLKMSMVIERIDVSCKSIMKEFQNVPRSMFPILYETLSSNDIYIIEDINTIREQDPITHQFFISHDVKSSLFHAIKAPNGMLIGFIGMEFTDGGCSNIEAAKKNIQRKAQRITGALVSHSNNI